MTLKQQEFRRSLGLDQPRADMGWHDGPDMGGSDLAAALSMTNTTTAMTNIVQQETDNAR